MQWHDLLGAVLIDFFEGSPYSVETEIDLSVKKQLLDIVVIRKGEGEFHRPLPDGMAPLMNHNLISFKSHQDTFDGWTVLELIGHYVNYRKQVSPSLDELLPEEEFRLYGITARFPEKLARETGLEEHQPGVYDIILGPTRIRLLVIRNMENQLPNAMLKLFSMVPEQIQYACRNYRFYSRQTTSIVQNLIRMYQQEDLKMATKAQEIYEQMKQSTLEFRLEGLTPKEILKVVPLEDILKAIPHEEILKELSPEEIEEYLRKMKEKKAKESP